MSELRIDAAKAERMIAQILRDEQKMLPAKANEVAATLCRRLSTSMPVPNNQQLQSYRMIPSHGPRWSGPKHLDSFADALQKKIGGDVEEATAREVWRLVWEYCDDLPAGVADAAR